jgi:hypothetical protein
VLNFFRTPEGVFFEVVALWFYEDRIPRLWEVSEAFVRRAEA